MLILLPRDMGLPTGAADPVAPTCAQKAAMFIIQQGGGDFKAGLPLSRRHSYCNARLFMAY
jgi:hypothetical protein